MQYQEYKKAALKHLKSCQAIVDYLDQSHYSISPLSEQFLLMNLFYLSGYTLECVINFALFKKIYTKNNFNTTLPVEKVWDTTENFGFSFSHKDNITKKQVWAKYCIQGHNFMKNIALLRRFIPSSSNLPLIHDKKNVPSSVFNLINTWKASCRYQTKQTYNRSEIYGLVEFTDKFYREVFKVVR